MKNQNLESKKALIRKKFKSQFSSSTSLVKKQIRFLQQSKQIFSEILNIDYNKEIKPQALKPFQIQTYGCLSQNEMKQVFEKFISMETLKYLIYDSIKVEYLYHPLRQAIQSQLRCLPEHKDEYKMKDILQIILKGKFYQYLQLKTQQAKFLINNRSTEINIKTLISAIITYMSEKLTIENISDILLFYRLQEALYECQPFGLPFEFEKIMKAMKKIQRNIVSEKFNKWQKRIKQIEKNRTHLQSYHFLYLISLSEPIVKKKKILLFQIDRAESKFEKQNQVLSQMKLKNNFIDFEKRKIQWRNQINVRGLKFYDKDQHRRVRSVVREFTSIRKKIISNTHKRVKSASICNQAMSRVKNQLQDRNETEHQYRLDTTILNPFKPQPRERKLLKKFYKRSQAKQEFEKAKEFTKNQFNTFYQESMNEHLQALKQAKNQEEELITKDNFRKNLRFLSNNQTFDVKERINVCL